MWCVCVCDSVMCDRGCVWKSCVCCTQRSPLHSLCSYYALTIWPWSVYTSPFTFALRNGHFTGFGSAGIQTQAMGNTWAERTDKKTTQRGLDKFDRFHKYKNKQQIVPCMLSIFRIFLMFFLYLRVVRCSEAKQGTEGILVVNTYWIIV